MNALFDPFTNNQFMQLALLGGVLVAVTCAIAGTFVVLRGLAFIGDALAHGVLPGIAAALLLGVSGVYGAIVGAAVMMGGVSVVQRRFKMSGDTAVGLLFVGMLALGVLITSRSETFVGDLTRVLFGELLGVNRNDIVFQLVALVVVAAVAFVGRRPFLLLSWDEGLTTTSGFSVRLFANLMLALVAITIIASVGMKSAFISWVMASSGGRHPNKKKRAEARFGKARFKTLRRRKGAASGAGLRRQKLRGSAGNLLFDLALQRARIGRQFVSRSLDEECVETAAMFHRAERIGRHAQAHGEVERIRLQRDAAEVRQELPLRLAV